MAFTSRAFAVLAVACLLCLVPAFAQNTNSTAVDTAPVNSTDAAAAPATSGNATSSCPLTDEALAGVDFSSTNTSCADINGADFCSSCLCSIASALVAGSPTFASLASNTTAAPVDINTLVEQCAGTLGPALLSSLTPDALTTLAACDLNAAAVTCSGGNTVTSTDGDMDVMANQGPAAPAPAPMPAPRATSSAGRVMVSAVVAAPVLLAMLLV